MTDRAGSRASVLDALEIGANALDSYANQIIRKEVVDTLPGAEWVTEQVNAVQDRCRADAATLRELREALAAIRIAYTTFSGMPVLINTDKLLALLSAGAEGEP